MGENDDLPLCGFLAEAIGDVFTTLIVKRRDRIVKDDARVIVSDGKLGEEERQSDRSPLTLRSDALEQGRVPSGQPEHSLRSALFPLEVGRYWEVLAIQVTQLPI
jgi:hypothetical protein